MHTLSSPEYKMEDGAAEAAAAAAAAEETIGQTVDDYQEIFEGAENTTQAEEARVDPQTMPSTDEQVEPAVMGRDEDIAENTKFNEDGNNDRADSPMTDREDESNEPTTAIEDELNAFFKRSKNSTSATEMVEPEILRTEENDINDRADSPISVYADEAASETGSIKSNDPAEMLEANINENAPTHSLTSNPKDEDIVDDEAPLIDELQAWFNRPKESTSATKMAEPEILMNEPSKAASETDEAKPNEMAEPETLGSKENIDGGAGHEWKRDPQGGQWKWMNMEDSTIDNFHEPSGDTNHDNEDDHIGVVKVDGGGIGENGMCSPKDHSPTPTTTTLVVDEEEKHNKEVSETENTKPNELAKKLEAAIKEDHSKETFSGGEQTPEPTDEPQPVVERVESPPPPKDEVEEPAPQANQATQLLDREILFDDSIINIQAFDDGSADARQKVQGWTNQKWIAASDKVLSYTAPVLRVMPGKYFWSSDVYEKRILATFNNPDIILIMRLPKDVDEVRRLLPIQGELELSTQELHAFLVVESVADPMTCKIRLSPLTHTTSVPSRELMQSNGPGKRNSYSPSQKNVPRRRSCFDILTPTEVATLSAAFLPDESFDDFEFTREKALNDTHRCEDAIVSALTNAHSLSQSLNGGTDQAWKHQVVLGTPHSYVISGSDQTLKDSLANALEVQNSRDDSQSSGLNKIDCIDARDGCGKTALHYACSRGKNSTVQILVSAGADCSVAQNIDGFTPCHICAQSLDEKTLSIVLSASYPTRPDPNALDRLGRTPMYLAAVLGKSNVSSSNALDLCLSALEAWGGQLIIDSPKSKELLHPVHCVSAQWKHEELSVVLSHCNYHYPLKRKDGSDPSGMSLSAEFHWPIHAALVSLRTRVVSAFTDKAGDEFNAEFMPLEPALVKTLRTLLEHGFESNERFEGIVGHGEDIKSFSCYFGFTPLQILALVATEVRAIDLKKQESGKVDDQTKRTLKNIMKIVQASAEILVKSGARINVPSPPPTRLDRPTPTGCYSLYDALKDQKDLSMQTGSYRECLKLDDNNEILSLLGGADRVNSFQNSFASVGKTVKNTGALVIESSSLDSDAPGGSDPNSCAICWIEFGVLMNRKHLCRVSGRYVCNECSKKRLVDNGSEHRVSDGQFLLAAAQAKNAEAKSLANREDKMRKQRQSVTQSRKALGLKSGSGPLSSTDTEAKQPKLSTKEKITSAISGLGQTRNAVLERGDKLESLADKTEALNQASLDFANMAKELERSQNSWW
ncbi:hypothetical protein ACHAXR_013483 [Thalassiosira sp. AJA248-18]